MIYRLISLTGPTKGQRFTVEQEPMTVGTDPACTIATSDAEMARRHAVIQHAPEGLVIRDLGSMNKILVNGREVREARLRHGDEVELGRSRFLVQAVVQAEVDAAPAPAPSAGRGRAFPLGPMLGVIALLSVLAAGAWVRLWLYTRKSAAPATPPPVTQLATMPPMPPLAPAELPDAPAQPPGETPAPETAAQPPEPVLPPDAPPVVPPVTSPPPSAISTQAPALASQEIRQMMESLAALRESVQDLASKQTSAPPAPPVVLPPPAPVPPAPEPARAAPTPARLLRIASMEQRKFPESDDIAEMRVVSIVLSPLNPRVAIDPAAVEVRTWFFDQDLATGAIVPTRAVVSEKPARPEGTWTRGEQKLVNATYVVSRGLKDFEADRGRSFSYYGYAVRVYLGGRLQAEDARPQSLLDYVAEDP